MLKYFKEFITKTLKRNEWKKLALKGEYVMAIRSLRFYGGTSNFYDAKTKVENLMRKNGITKIRADLR